MWQSMVLYRAASFTTTRLFPIAPGFPWWGNATLSKSVVDVGQLASHNKNKASAASFIGTIPVQRRLVMRTLGARPTAALPRPHQSRQAS